MLARMYIDCPSIVMHICVCVLQLEVIERFLIVIFYYHSERDGNRFMSVEHHIVIPRRK